MRLPANQAELDAETKRQLDVLLAHLGEFVTLRSAIVRADAAHPVVPPTGQPVLLELGPQPRLRRRGQAGVAR